MRRLPFGSGWVLLAAAALPFVVEVAKPLAKAVGKGFRKLGEMIDEASDEVEKCATEAEDLAAKASKADTATKPTTKKPAAKKPATKKTASKKSAPKASTPPPRHEPPKPTVVQSASMRAQNPTTGARRRPPRDIETG